MYIYWRMGGGPCLGASATMQLRVLCLAMTLVEITDQMHYTIQVWMAVISIG